MTDRGGVAAVETGVPEASGAFARDPFPRDPLVARALARVGGTLREKWGLDVLLGVGGMAAVYAATHRNGSRAAVKILHPGMSSNAFVRERFMWEGYAANAVGHDGAVKVIDDDQAEDGSLYLVTELLDGETLEERRIRAGGRIPQEEVLLVAYQVLDVLVAAHSKGIVHRDLKPENVFLTRSGQIKVLDFGLARLRELSTSTNLTQAGGMVGTPAYMAPEHARGLSEQVDERSDIWACGATMFCLLSGRGVHDGRDGNELLANAMAKPSPPLISVAADVDVAVANVVDKALEFSSEMRWPSAVEMQQAVAEAYEQLTGQGIRSAPALLLGDDVPDRTLRRMTTIGPVPVHRAPTTSDGVMTSVRSALQPWSTRARKLGLTLVGVVALAVVALALGAGAGRARRAAAVATAVSAAGVSAVPRPTPSAVVLSPVVAPEVSFDDLPPPPPSNSARFIVKSPVRSRPASGTQQLAPTPVPTSTQTSSPQCQPPYVVDVATGKKRWKLECL